MTTRTDAGGRRGRRVRLGVVLGVVLAAGAGVGGWVMVRSGEAGADVHAGTPAGLAAASMAASAATSTASRPGITALPSASLVSGVSGVSAASAASAPPGAVGARRPWGLPPEKVAEIEKQWCSHGQAAHRQAMAAVDRATPVDFSASEVDMSARVTARLQDVGLQAREGVKQRLFQQWIAQLQARGDVRSRAAAAFLGTRANYGSQDAPHMRALRALAEGSRDPLVWHLWRIARSYCFDRPACGPATLKPWHEIEPENLLAWLPDARGTDIPPAHWPGIRAARYARSYREDFMGLLLPLVEREAPGLALQEGLSLISQQSDFWPTLGATSAILKACTPPETDGSPDRQAACRRAAELLWTLPQPSLHDRIASLRMAAANGDGEQAVWQSRASFVRTVGEADFSRFMEVQFRNGWEEQPCEAQPRQRETLKAIAQGGEWAAALGPERSARTP